METLLTAESIILVLFAFVILWLLVENQTLKKKVKYVDKAKMWHQLAVRDDLTKVYNRNAYNMHIRKDRSCKYKKISGVILCDIDDFKSINDTEGHLAGDEVLKNVARTLLDIFHEPEYRVFRIGGDEFSVLARDADEIEILEQLDILEKSLEATGSIRLSMGYAVVQGDVEEAFKNADEMMYDEKMLKKA